MCLLAIGGWLVSGCESGWKEIRISNRQLEQLNRQAEPFITALERYQAEHGFYPPHFRVLVPEYVSEETPLLPEAVPLHTNRFLYRPEHAYFVPRDCLPRLSTVQSPVSEACRRFLEQQVQKAPERLLDLDDQPDACPGRNWFDIVHHCVAGWESYTLEWWSSGRSMFIYHPSTRSWESLLYVGD
jgi:hypothetical protein